MSKLKILDDPKVEYVISGEGSNGSRKLAGMIFYQDLPTPQERLYSWIALIGSAIGILGLLHYLIVEQEGNILATIRDALFGFLELAENEAEYEASLATVFSLLTLISLFFFVMYSNYTKYILNFKRKVLKKVTSLGIFDIKALELPLDLIAPSDVIFQKHHSGAILRIALEPMKSRMRAQGKKTVGIPSEILLLEDYSNIDENIEKIRKIAEDLREAISAITQVEEYSPKISPKTRSDLKGGY